MAVRSLRGRGRRTILPVVPLMVMLRGRRRLRTMMLPRARGRRGIAACGRRRRDVARAMVLREGRDRGRGENSKKSTAFHDVYLHHFF